MSRGEKAHAWDNCGFPVVFRRRGWYILYHLASTVDKKFRTHLKAFLISHQIGEDPNKKLARVRVIANTNPEFWNGKLPIGEIHPDNSICTVTESAKNRPVVPWAWYERAGEPIPEVVKDIYQRLSFDFAVTFPKDNVWIYVSVEPSQKVLGLLSRQEHLKAFILISLINRALEPKEREHRRIRLANVMGARDMDRVFAFSAFREEDPRFRTIPKNVPTISRLVHPTSNTANWNIRLPNDPQVYGSFKEIIPPR